MPKQQHRQVTQSHLDKVHWSAAPVMSWVKKDHGKADNKHTPYYIRRFPYTSTFQSYAFRYLTDCLAKQRVVVGECWI